MAFTEIKQMLKETIGLHPGSVGDTSIERAIGHRMNALSITSAAAYLARLDKDVSEFEELIEEVVVPETWFFRNVAPFEALASYYPGLQLEKGNEPSPLKILSLPCATGEEPYSIAMILMEKGLATGKFEIDAVDVSKRAIRKAKRAIYGKHSFREENLALRDKYFHKTQAGFQLDNEVKQHVNFTRANILERDYSPGEEVYDVIFCRNLLIYFDRDTQNRVLTKLSRMLRSQGILCVGHAEAAQVTKNYFLPLEIPMAFAFSKSAETKERLRAGKHDTVKQLEDVYQKLLDVVNKDKQVGAKKYPKHHPGADRAVAKMATVGSVLPAVSLAKVSEFIDLGRFDEAAVLCEAYLRQNPHSAEAYFYLGLVSQLKGSQGAAEALQKKAIYLDPDCHQAFEQLALLAEKRGDMESATAYRRREQRALIRKSKAGDSDEQPA